MNGGAPGQVAKVAEEEELTLGLTSLVRGSPPSAPQGWLFGLAALRLYAYMRAHAVCLAMGFQLLGGPCGGRSHEENVRITKYMYTVWDG